ncbi:hypothetical protein EK21DRAFT_61952 [Setomelanomma holmii]|uniref:Rhodopsin domain-containing protein n=1 Tax=Setomelanomma holmii TaxID=210430 RepID=A0A9P4HBK2_9PLEO|nr:hypothetical protein EK21DRAFT_61952 [Setomelanomma holmii]
MASATDEQKKSWPPPNYENPQNLDGLIIGLVAPTLALAVILFPLVCLDLGLGRHIWDQKPEWHTLYWKMGYTADLLFPAACSLTKISLCLTYFRLFPSRSDKLFCYAMAAFVTLYTVTCVFLSLFQCRPIRSYWDLDVEQKCINMRATLVAIAALNSFSDFLVYLWPTKPLWGLHLPVKQRLGLIFMFSVGLLVCVAGVLRMYYLEIFFESYDTLWNGSAVWLCMVLEMDIGIICGCLSGVKPVLATVCPAFFSSSYRTRSGPTRPTYGVQTGRTAHGESFAFQPLSDISNSKKPQSNKLEHAFSVEALKSADDQGQRNFAWASSSGKMEINKDIPTNAIGVSQVVSVEQEETGSITPKTDARSKMSDAGSEEWIMDDGPKSRKA